MTHTRDVPILDRGCFRVSFQTLNKKKLEIFENLFKKRECLKTETREKKTLGVVNTTTRNRRALKMAPNNTNPPHKPPPKSKANTNTNNNALYKQKKGRIAKAFPKSYKNKAKSYEFMMMHREQQQQQQQKMNDTDDDKNDDEDVAKEQDLMMKTSDDEKKKKDDDDDENDEKHYVLDLGEMQRRLASERNTTNTRRSNTTNKRVGYQSAKGKRGGGENNKPERKLGGFRFSGRGDGAQRVVFLAGVALRGEKEESGEFGNEVPGMV